MEAMARGVNPIPVKAEYFTEQIKEMADNVKTLDNVEDAAQITGDSDDLTELRDQLESLAEFAQNMQYDIEEKYADLMEPDPGGGC